MNILSNAITTVAVMFTPVSANEAVEVAPQQSVAQVVQDTVQEETKKSTQETVEDLARQKTLDRWKSKQVAKWENLPTEDFTINASAYTAAADECGKSDGVTASGVVVEDERTLACPPEYPFGAQIEIDGMGVFTCEDRGGAIKGNKFDIYMETKSDAFAFGRQNLTARVVF